MKYVCGVCKKTFESKRPPGGFFTLYGEVIVCSNECFIEHIKYAVTLGDMVQNLTRHDPDCPRGKTS